jgi:hypothetical protein
MYFNFKGLGHFHAIDNNLLKAFVILRHVRIFEMYSTEILIPIIVDSLGEKNCTLEGVSGHLKRFIVFLE